MTEFDPPLGRSRTRITITTSSWSPAVDLRWPGSRRWRRRSTTPTGSARVTVATGADPMAVHEAFEALGVPADVTQLLRDPIDPGNPAVGRRDADDAPRRAAGRPRPVGDHGLRRRDDRGDRRAGRVLAADPGRAPAGGGGERRPALPVPAGGQPAGHRPARLAVPHHRRRRAGQPDRARTRSRSATRWPPTRSPPTCGSPACSAGCGPSGRASCWSALDRLDSLGVLAGLPELLDGEPDIEVVLFGELGAHGAAAPIAQPPARHRRPQRAARRSRGPAGRQRRARLRQPRAGQRRARASARPPCSSTARTSPSRATRSAASSARA